MDLHKVDEFWDEIKEINTIPFAKRESLKSDITDSPSAHSIFSENDHSFDSVSSLPTPLKQPRFASDDTVDVSRASLGQKKTHTGSRPGSVKFVAANDIPKRRSKTDHRFNKIRAAVKTEEVEDIVLADWLGQPSRHIENHRRSVNPEGPSPSTMFKQSVGGFTDDECEENAGSAVELAGLRRASKTKYACNTCRAKKMRCTHNEAPTKAQGHEIALRSGSGANTRGEIDTLPGTKLRVKTEPGENRIKKDGTPYVKVPYDRSRGPSMTKTAVDYRERKVIQQEYQDRFVALLDEDIIEEVEREGGITPLGRLLKAGVRMLERYKCDRPAATETTSDLLNVQGDGEALVVRARRETATAVQQFDTFKAQLQAMLDKIS